MKLGIQSLQFTSSRERPMAEQFEDALESLRYADEGGFDWISASQHWMSAPTVWPQPFPWISHMAAEFKNIGFMTQMLVLPLHNAVDVAEQFATIDHLSRGRLILGCANGYRELELTAAGVSRKDRTSRVEEGIALMKALWSGRPVEFEGRWWNVQGGQMGYSPYRQPHPPIVLAAQSIGATKRAARIAEGVFYGPQASFGEIEPLIELYRRTAEEHERQPGIIGAGRAIMIADSREAALRSAHAYAEKTMKMYSGWDMQEPGMASLRLEGDLDEWAIIGWPQDCVEQILKAHAVGLNHITLTAYNLPSDQQGRIEYVQRLAEEVVQPVKRALGEAVLSTPASGA
ncbi:LLM class flavin-dependent oxidoreductase [Nonomuraea sp. NPDC026600]|uniref:LLM class flavin-dependent oxidoreductase n=1 Tax=Nonomuraea sp. NPDC026600 TaxID=3155363 RepID=UPI0033E50CA3